MIFGDPRAGYDETGFLESIFVGRQHELRELEAGLVRGKERVALITGRRGDGKTMLAQVFARRFHSSFPAGVFTIYATEFQSLVEEALRVLPDAEEPALLIIDEANHHEESEINSQLQAIVGSRPAARLIVCSQHRIEPGLAGRALHLGNFSRAEMAELISKRLGRVLDASALDELYRVFQGNPLASTVATGTIRDSLFTLNELLRATEPVSKPGLVGPDGQPLPSEGGAYRSIIADVRSVSDEMLRRISEDPNALYRVSPRVFELVVANLLERLGYEITLTPVSRDGGKDIYAAKKDTLGSFLYIVECKKFSPDRRVGVGLIRNLYGVVQAEKATAGILATTSFFTRDARHFQQQVAFQISLQDYFGIRDWLRAAQL